MNYEGLKNLMYFAYGSLLKGVCSDLNTNFTEKVESYLEGGESLEEEIIKEMYEELPHAIQELHELSVRKKTEPFSLENVNEYIFKVHNSGVRLECWVMSGAVKSIDQEKRILEVSRNGENFQIQYLPSLEESFKLGNKVHFHHGWLIKK